MKEEMMECPICGKRLPVSYFSFLDNGNPACRDCVNKENKRAEQKNNKAD